MVLGLSPAAPVFRFADPRIDEASGLALGIRSPGIAYVQNDSGDVNRVFAVDRRTGRTAAVVTIRGATNVDWEDLAVAPDASGTPSLWIADIGDNQGSRREVHLYRVREPSVHASSRDASITTEPAAVWRLRYPDGRPDAEALAVTPHGVAYVISKSVFGRSTVYRVPADPDRGRVQLLRRVATIVLAPHGVPNPFGLAGELAITGASMSRDGRVLAVRTYAEAYVWPVRDGDVPAALRRPPVRVDLPRQPQGEGIAVVDDRGALIDSEGVHSTVDAVTLPPLESRAARASSNPAPPPSPRATIGRHARTWPWFLAGSVVALTIAVVAVRRRSARTSASRRIVGG